MGALSFKGESPNQSDALMAKNYCNKEELSALNCVVSAYLEFAEILTHAEKISAKTVVVKAKEEYCKYKTLHLEDVSKVEKDYVKALENMALLSKFFVASKQEVKKKPRA